MGINNGMALILIDRVLESENANEWEQKFCHSILSLLARNPHAALTPKQAAKLIQTSAQCMLRRERLGVPDSPPFDESQPAHVPFDFVHDMEDHGDCPGEQVW